MHGSSLCRMRWFVDNFLTGPAKLHVLDVGSCDVAGGTYRQFFSAGQFDYVGLDLVQGPNVDIVPKLPYSWPEIADCSFDVAISGQAFEHMEFFWLAAAEMARVLKPGGWLCLVAPRGFERHRHPVDCYRFDSDGMVAIARWCGLQPVHASTDMAPPTAGKDWHIEGCEDSFLIARKPEKWQGAADAATYVFTMPRTEELAGDFTQCEKIAPPPVIALTEHQLQLAALNKEIESRNSALAQKEAEIARLHKLIEDYERSNSWRLTRPLRELCALWRRVLGK